MHLACHIRALVKHGDDGNLLAYISLNPFHFLSLHSYELQDGDAIVVLVSLLSDFITL